MSYRQWDLILVPFPFTDLSTIKRRPALIISPEDYNQSGDLIIAFVTSQINVKAKPGDYKILEWQKSGLPKPSMIRMKFATIHLSIVVKSFGQLSENDSTNFKDELIQFFS